MRGRIRAKSDGKWEKFPNPSAGDFATKTSSWTTDSFTSGFEVDFKPIVREGTKAIKCFIRVTDSTGNGMLFYRKSGDPNISNTPVSSAEYSHRLWYAVTTGLDNAGQCTLWLSNDYKVEFASRYATLDLYIAYPVEYMR